jgi:hypothetical protein
LVLNHLTIKNIKTVHWEFIHSELLFYLSSFKRKYLFCKPSNLIILKRLQQKNKKQDKAYESLKRNDFNIRLR